jgi:hypothetical protein
MPEYRHPRAGDGPGQPPARVHVSRAENAPVTDGTFTAPEGVARAIADAHGVDVSEMRVGGASDGCPWCDDYDGDAWEQHAAQAHPEEWADYSEDSDE